MSIKKLISAEQLFLSVFFIIILIQPALSLRTSVIRYIDEILCLVCQIYIFSQIFSKGIPSRIFQMQITMCICIILGLIGNFTSGIERTALDIFTDILACFKDFICLEAAFLFFRKHPIKKSTYHTLMNISELFVIFAFFFLLLSQFVDLNMTGAYRFGIRNYMFIYRNPGVYSQIFVLVFITLSVSLQTKKKNWE